MNRSVLIGSLVVMAGCATADRVQELEDRLAAAEEQITRLEATAAAAPAAAAARSGNSGENAVDTAKEEAANAMFEEIAELIRSNKMEEAKARIEEMESQFSDTRAWRRARKTAQELAVIGKAAPGSLNVEQWFQGEGEVNLSSDQPTLLVFWEEWCPHCKREVPEMQATYEQFRGRGLQMVGLTKITRRSSLESVTQFIADNNVGYPMAKEDGSISRHFNVSGIPAAAVVKDGQIIWRGHPARLTDEIIESWL